VLILSLGKSTLKLAFGKNRSINTWNMDIMFTTNHEVTEYIGVKLKLYCYVLDVSSSSLCRGTASSCWFFRSYEKNLVLCLY
jgi:hypothetical protein